MGAFYVACPIDVSSQMIVDWRPARTMKTHLPLVSVGRAEVSVDDIGASRATGSSGVHVGVGRLVVAEGIFAAEIIHRLRDEGLLHSAWHILHNRWITFARRLARDLSKRHKAPHIVVRRGLARCRAEPEVVARREGLGATCTSPAHAEERLSRG